MSRFVAIAVCLLGAIPGIPNPAVSAGEPQPPWSERVLSDHVDFVAFAGKPDRLDELVAIGERLFTAKFTRADGLGRPLATQAIIPTKRRRPAPLAMQRLSGPDANGCASCHHDPVAGGAGPFTANAFVSEGFESADFDTLDPQFSNERGTNFIHGAGLIELLAREMSVDLGQLRIHALTEARNLGAAVRIKLTSKGVEFGHITARADGTVDLSEIDGVDSDLVVRPFSQKGVITSLRQFTINAANHHHGLQASERFGRRWTGVDDFDGDGIADELSRGDISALVAFQATLPMPGRRSGMDTKWAAMSQRGQIVFGELGCPVCHRPSLPLKSLRFTDPNPFDMAGTLRRDEVGEPITIDLTRFPSADRLQRNEQGEWLVPLFGDLKRHRIADKKFDHFGNELLSQRFVDRDVFQTAELWGIGSSAPYGHRGDLSTLSEAIAAHGGEANDARRSWLALDERDRQAVIAFLRTLVIVP